MTAAEAHASSFRSQGYAAVSGVISQPELGSLRRHYRRLVQSGAMGLGDNQSPLRYVAHNEAAAREIQRRLKPGMAALAGVAVQPSYAYAACYQPGASLPRHIDREQCEYSISVCIDYVPEPADTTPWPLWLETPGGTLAIHQALGDALFYRGREVPHFRTRLPAGHYSTSLFLHYVDASFRGRLD